MGKKKRERLKLRRAGVSEGEEKTEADGLKGERSETENRKRKGAADGKKEASDGKNRKQREREVFA